MRARLRLLLLALAALLTVGAADPLLHAVDVTLVGASGGSPHQYIIDGDSRGYGSVYTTHGANDWLTQMLPRLRGARVGSTQLNIAVNGSLGGHSGFDVVPPALSTKVVILVTGTNGYSGTATGGTPQTGAQVEAVIAAQVAAYRAAGVTRIVVCTEYVSTGTNPEVDAGNALIIAHATSGGYIVLPLHTLLATAKNDVSLFPDATHYSIAGAAYLASVAAPYVNAAAAN